MLEGPHTIAPPRPYNTTPVPSPNPPLLGLGTLLLCAGLAAVLFWSGTAVMFRYAIPLMALVLGAVFLQTAPVLYVGFTWWLWFLTPFARRVIDYQAGWQDPNLVMLTPYLVSGLAVFTLIRHRSRLLDKHLFPFALAIAGILYGYVIGILKVGPATATYDVLRWLVPVFFGLHVALLSETYPAFRCSIQRALLGGIVVMGVYAVAQFYVLPPWDAFWMIKSEMGSIGQPYPFKVRIFSTMSSPGPFAAVMMAGVLMLFGMRKRMFLVAAVPGYTGFLLALVRSAWGGWAMALLLMAAWTRDRMRRRLVGVLLLGSLVVVPALTVPAISNRLGDRFESFKNFSEDRSLNARMKLYKNVSLRALTNPVGTGLGTIGTAQKMRTGKTKNFDSGVLTITQQFGWPGLLLYLGGLVLLAKILWQIPRRTEDMTIAVSSAIAFSILAMLLFRSALTGASGAVFWCFAGLALGGYRYHQVQEVIDEDSTEPGRSVSR
ncbi:MAG: O-antigen ligase family protein [Rhodothermales bacterium]